MPAHARAVVPRPRAIATIALAIATLGVAIPYGTASGPAAHDINLLEWVLSALALIAGLGLVADLIPRLNPSAYARGAAFMTAGFVWAVIAAYVILAPGDQALVWRLGHAIPDAGWAVLGLTAWRLVVKNGGAKRGETP